MLQQVHGRRALVGIPTKRLREKIRSNLRQVFRHFVARPDHALPGRDFWVHALFVVTTLPAKRVFSHHHRVRSNAERVNVRSRPVRHTGRDLGRNAQVRAAHCQVLDFVRMRGEAKVRQFENVPFAV